jgi:hypothetical protein
LKNHLSFGVCESVISQTNRKTKPKITDITFLPPVKEKFTY